MYGIYLVGSGDKTQDSRRKATDYYEGRAFRLHELPINHREPSDEVFSVHLGAEPPRITTLHALTVNGVVVAPGTTVALEPPINSGDDKVFRLKIFEYEFDLTVFKYYMEVEE